LFGDRHRFLKATAENKTISVTIHFKSALSSSKTDIVSNSHLRDGRTDGRTDRRLYVRPFVTSRSDVDTAWRRRSRWTLLPRVFVRPSVRLLEQWTFDAKTAGCDSYFR